MNIACSRHFTGSTLLRAVPRQRRVAMRAAAAGDKLFWLRTSSKEALAAALEAGVDAVLFDDAATAAAWRSMGRFEAVVAGPDGALLRDGAAAERVGTLRLVRSPADMDAALAAVTAGPAPEKGDVLVVEPHGQGWTQIPAENLIAARGAGAGSGRTTLLAVARDAGAAAALLEALEAGTDGVVLHTDDGGEVRALAAFLASRAAAGAGALRLAPAEVVAVRAAGAGDRACVDLAAVMRPGEGLLVGSFARALFLVHSECVPSGGYVNTRPFRVNAGPVHSYVQAPAGKTAYLSELASGDEVLVAGVDGRARAATVGRVKVERRPLVLVAARTADGEEHSVLLQNAETVRLCGPAAGGAGGWRALSVAELQPGDEVYVLRQGAARHTGLAIDEQIVER